MIEYPVKRRGAEDGINRLVEVKVRHVCLEKSNSVAILGSQIGFRGGEHVR